MVWIASRSLGGVSITLISRKPTSDMCSVRGMGVADMVSTSHVLAHLLQAFFVRHAESLLFVDDEQAQVLKLHVFRKQAVRADDDVDLARPPDPRAFSSAPSRVRNRLSISMRTGNADEAPPERLVVLKGEHRGRRQHGDLLRIVQRP